MPASETTILPVPTLLSLAMRPLPLLPLQPPLMLLLGSIVRRHPNLFARLGSHADKRFGIHPTDLPFAFLLEPRQDRPNLTAVRTLPDQLDVRISGPLSALLGMVNGELDGDALFFSRDLKVEGDFEAVVALRNAVDDAGINMIDEVRGVLGPLGRPVEKALRFGLERWRDSRGAEGRA
jgi:predicted lipid carrier protein YhbT